MNIINEDVKELIAEIPEGHKHLRTTIALKNGMEITLQEATVANLVRAYITVKTHPLKNRVRLKSSRSGQSRPGYAEWQLLEDGADHNEHK